MTNARPLIALLAASMLTACGSASDKSEAEQAPSNPAATKPAKAPDVHAFRIGEFQAFALADGAFTFPNDGKTFGLGHKPGEVGKLLSAAGLPADTLSVDIHPLLVKSPIQVMLFDTGAGRSAGADGGKLTASLAAAGVDPASVTDIFISHVHGDHVGGLLDADGALAFPRAVIHMSSPEWTYLRDQAKESETAAALVTAIAPKIAPFAPGIEILPGKVQAVEIRGHTPGHSGYRILSGDSSLLYVGDAVHHHIISVRKPDWPIEFDGDKAVAAASRHALLKDSADTGQRLYAPHFPFPNVGTVKPDGDGFRWVPE